MKHKVLKTFLFLLLSFVAVTSVVSGLLLVIKPSGEILRLPLSLVNGTIFRNFLIPGTLLFAIVGGTNFVAALKNLQNRANGYNWAMAAGFIICGWIIAQTIIIHTLHWSHILYLGMGISIILLTYQLKGKWVV